MKMLFSTTALVVVLGFPALSLAQTTAANTATQDQNAQMPGFLAERGQADLFASDLMGHDVYARRTSADTSASGNDTTMNADGTDQMSVVNRTDVEDMDNIGQVTEIVLSNDGRVRALVIGVGGFLGMGEHDVAVTMDQISFATDAEARADTGVDAGDWSQMYIIVNTSADMLTDAPAYARTTDEASSSERSNHLRADQMPADRTAFAAPEMMREGYNQVEVTDVSTEMLMEKTVYDVNENDVGTVTDMIIDDAGGITDVIIDFGGFLGIGSSQASLGFDELTILTTQGYEDVRLYVDATKEQIQDLPQYQASN